ncbi:tyrosine-type recombinase/integrase [Hoyosella altamirensis]|uniref:Integrase n=1 Tax=Hoyosella altamirensis TaxID=616997 RepID=A0A839RSQ9_9ACTN|nr:site-specific integrase [Hoyosella altamirensis]MBB3039600.1 integrase [Hoyosella altamirensis]
MASVQKKTLKSGATRYEVRYRTPDGKCRTKGGFTTKQTAEAYATDIDYKQRRGHTWDAKAGQVVFRDAAAQWLDTRHDLKPRTRAGYAHYLRASGPIDTALGGYPLAQITRQQISDFVEKLIAASKAPSTVRHYYFVVKMVLAQAVVDGRLDVNLAEHVKVPSETSAQGSAPGVVDDPAQFLTAAQVATLVAATPWPYGVLVHVAAWTGLRAAELGGLQVGDVELPPAPRNPNATPRPGVLRVERTFIIVGGQPQYDAPKTKGSRRRVPLTPATTALLRAYLAQHPHGPHSAHYSPSAPLFPAFRLIAEKPTGVKAIKSAAAALAELSPEQAAARLELDWDTPVRHPNFFKAIYRPAVLRANRLTRERGGDPALLPADLRFHALRHTYASLCVAAGLPALAIAKYMGHAKVTTTLTIYAHLFDDDHTDAMAALGALGQPAPKPANVVQMIGVG